MTATPASRGNLKPDAGRKIIISGARVHNLRDVSLQIPLGSWTAITGVSGSGKSSLALDTIHAEGQRRYFETLSSSARLFLQQLERPDVDRIDHLPPSIAIGQRNRPETGTAQLCDAVEVLDSLAILAMHIAIMYCPKCQAAVIANDEAGIRKRIDSLPDKTRLQITFPLDIDDGIPKDELKLKWEQEGYHRFIDLKQNESPFTSLVLMDRLVAGNISAERLSESLEQAFSAGQKQIVLLIDPKSALSETQQHRSVAVQETQGREWSLEFYSQQRCCSYCHQKYPEIQPHLFRRTSPVGACEKCSGTGLTKRKKQALRCERCHGLGLNQLAREVRIADQPMQTLLRMSSENLLEFLNRAELFTDAAESENTGEILQELRLRLGTLCKTGLGYLHLDRKLTSLSSGEYHRVSLVNALCSSLVNTLYIFDEPSAGLHQYDCQPVLEAIKDLRDQDNTVIMVEHNAEMISQVEHVVELGPAAGLEGGDIIFEGTFSDLLKQENSCTANWLNGKASLAEYTGRPITSETSFLSATKICCRNVQQASVKFPLQRLSIITGVSGSGKTSLLCDSISPALTRKLTEQREMTQSEPEAAFSVELSGYESIAESILVNDVAVARSIRSTPITYIKAFDEIRKLFASTADAQTLGFQPTRFSFNSSAAGRCSHCSGNGIIEIDMHFLANQSVACPECKGKRFNAETLSVKYRSRTIHDVLSMTIDEAFSFFHNHQSLQRRLQMLREVGLGYLRTGQSLSTLSGGEAQRLKLASFLSESSGKSKLYLFDEPTAGLHPQDTATLISCFRRLVEHGHTVIAIDHHSLMLEAADWVVDLGPGAAEQGGKVLFAGLPGDLQNCRQSITAKYLNMH